MYWIETIESLTCTTKTNSKVVMQTICSLICAYPNVHLQF